MGRIRKHCALPLLALVVLALPAIAGESGPDEMSEMRARLEKLEKRQATLLELEIDNYLDDEAVWRGAQAEESLKGLTISARFTTVAEATAGLDPANRSVVSGILYLDFMMEVTDRLNLFAGLMASTEPDDGGFSSLNGVGVGATAGTGFPGFFGPVTTPQGDSFGAIAGRTFSGYTDGIGVNGTVSVNPGDVKIYEAGIHSWLEMGSTEFHWEIGMLDPRTRFMQTAFADDEHTQFLNNVFDDSPAILWLSDASGRGYAGIHMWLDLGKEKNWRVNFGWFNSPGQFWNAGQLYVQVGWRGQVGGREMNARLTGFFDDFFQDATSDGSTGVGFTWDWMVTGSLGLFLRYAQNFDNINPIEWDLSGGAQWKGLIGSRPEDVLGVGLGLIQANTAVLTVPEDTEFIVEVYYRLMYQNGRLQITPYVMYVGDPGGNGAGWQDDSLVILGVRIHVPF